MASGPATSRPCLMPKRKIIKPFLTGFCPAIKSCFYRTINTGVTLQVMNHASTQCKGNNHEKEINSVSTQKPQRSPYSRAHDGLYPSCLSVPFKTRPDKGQQCPDDRQLTGPVWNDPRPFMGDFFEEMALTDWKQACDRIVEHGAEQTIHLREVKYQERHKGQKYWQTEIRTIKTKSPGGHVYQLNGSMLRGYRGRR